jgi:D-arabinose 1-dehydrogenase-like Zn-dependent alcohol dehydrogenase
MEQFQGPFLDGAWAGALVSTLGTMPELGVGRVLIRVSAAGVNRYDVHRWSAGRHSGGLSIGACGIA